MKKMFILVFCWSLLLAPVYAQEYTGLDGSNITYDILVSSPKTILFIWTSWCPSCRSELNSVGHDKTLPQDVRIYYVNLGEDLQTVEAAADYLQLPQDVKDNIVLDKDSVTAFRFSLVGVPTVLFFRDQELIKTTHYLNRELIIDVFGEYTGEQAPGLRVRRPEFDEAAAGN